MMFKKLQEQIQVQKVRELDKKDLKSLQEQEFQIESILEEINDLIKGGKADNHTVESIAALHKVSVEQIQKQIEKGIKVETEHVDGDEKRAAEIAKDHLVEFPDYYDRLDKMEEKAKADLKESYNAYLEILREESMPEDPQYGLPELKKFPLYDKKHVLAAIKFFNWVSPKDESKLAHAIIAKMKEHGLRQSNVGDENKLKNYVLKVNLPE